MLAERGYVRWEKRYVRRDGESVWADVSVAIVRDAFGEPRFKIAIANDITERKALESQLCQSQKLEAVGRLAGGVAHDFNNLLTAIIGYASLLLSRTDVPAEVTREAGEISHAAERAALITRQLLAFSRRQVLYPRVLDLNAVVRRTVTMLERLIGEDVKVRQSLADDLKAVRVDPGQLEQVVLNLVLNARDAMPGGGRLTIETRNAGERIELVVQDTGVGMDAATRDRIFEPFFTTREGLGNGLGLATVYGIVEQSGGEIVVVSAPEAGATFHVLLPAVDEAPTVESVQGEARGGTETVLLVEDEEMLRRLARRVLSQHGYTVLEAGDGDEALTVAEATGSPIDLVLTDVVMPNLSGPELGERISALQPLAKVVYMSGYLDADGASSAIARGAEFIAKPFTPSAVIAKIRGVLDGAP